ncbi:PREDICTED: U3 small nucleolar RNA-associated protein 6 homolog [Condylura cristata]|uniref:U3 small nucleolar RNA-associated protein 6 homolog n=1 Tax=Condylura cristata TaxID=143302 RepID=UPI000643423E|nr:PREDICTED: U3 small nucleolar RNA-associated protein 6 homolog [Condylura cristata]
MAEIIQERIEDRLPELEQLERIGLFSHKEIKAIIKKASDLEYKIQRRALATKTQLSKVYSAMLAIHSNKPALWIMAAKWEMEDRLSSESARQLFLRALRFHPECPKLYQEVSCLRVKKVNLDYPEEILKGELARIIYKNSISKIKGAEFHVSLLSIAQLFDFAKDLQREIYDDLQTMHTDDPLTWDYVARRELEIESQPGEEQPTTKQAKAVEVGRREERCSAVYEEAVKTLPTEAMWKCYFSFCLERFAKKTSSQFLREKRLERTVIAFKKAHGLKLLPEPQYKQWIQLLLDHDFLKEALEVADAGTELFRDSVMMWQMKLQVLIHSKSPDMAVLFEEAFVCLKPQDCLPLWLSWAEWSEGAKSQEDTEAIFKKAMLTIRGTDSIPLKEKYLDWAYRSGGYKKARTVFKSLQESRPFSVDFFRKIIQFEKEQESCKMANLREYYERALREFGSIDSDLWMDYIKEELNHPLGRPENCGQIYWRAMKMLQGESAEVFVAKHAMHQSGHL